ncbi:hypothetical protein BCR22_07425 [Enterococcus plantarum]|uniref:hypothetical protein n=1 Tax=Enterococcus plantarum TaxID=1077675 RepID=UPI00084DC951|nr:hypothetical protein [Enterococcus plantarum]OEG09417.1 hypothetical protein BCR22_07425 [Enterococcus plantarum]
MLFDWKNLNLKKTVDRLVDLVENHIGSNEKEAHKAANEFTHGFATPGMYKGANNIRLRGALKQYKSVFDIPSGLYETYADFGDLPNGLSNTSSIIQLRIERGLGNRKQIWLTEGYNGTLWYYTMHTDSNSYNPEGWTRLPRIEEVWRGTAKDKGTVIALNQHMTHFRSIRVWYELADGDSWICKEFEANKSFNLREFDVFNGSAGAILFEIRITRNSNNQLTVEQNKGLDLGTMKDTASNLRIRMIEGVA